MLQFRALWKCILTVVLGISPTIVAAFKTRIGDRNVSGLIPCSNIPSLLSDLLPVLKYSSPFRLACTLFSNSLFFSLGLLLVLNFCGLFRVVCSLCSKVFEFFRSVCSRFSNSLVFFACLALCLEIL